MGKQSKITKIILCIFLVILVCSCATDNPEPTKFSEKSSENKQSQEPQKVQQTFVFVWSTYLDGSGLPNMIQEDLRIWNSQDELEKACTDSDYSAYPEWRTPERLYIYGPQDINPSNFAYQDGDAKPLLETKRILSKSGTNISIEEYSKSNGQGQMMLFCAEEWLPAKTIENVITLKTFPDSNIEWNLDNGKFENYIMLWDRYSSFKDEWISNGYDYSELRN